MGYLKNLKNKIKSFKKLLVGEYGERKDFIVLIVLIICIFAGFVAIGVGLYLKLLTYISLGGLIVAVFGLIVSAYFTSKHGKEYSSYIREFRGYMTDLNELLTKAGEIIEGSKESIKIVTVWLGCGSVLAKVGHAAYIGSLYKKAAEEKVKKEYLFSISSDFKTDLNVFLFSVGTEMGEELNKGSIPEKLKNELEPKGVPLPGNPIARKKDDGWVICDEKTKETYCIIVRKEDGKLNIYKNISERCLFSIDGAFVEENLNKCVISKDLKDEFKTKEIPLSENATIRKEKADNKWEITNGEEIYIIKKEEGELNIYSDLNRIFEKNKCQLSKNATISRVNKNEWEISDGKKECTIRESGNHLNIYKNGKFEITVITLPPEIARKRTEEEFPISNKAKPGYIDEIVENDKTIGKIMKKLRIKIKYHDRVQFHVFIVDDEKALFYMEEPVKEKEEAVKEKDKFKIVGYVTKDPRMVDVLIQMFKRMDEESKPYEWEYLFCMKVDYAKYLKDGAVDANVEKEFKDSKHPLSDKAEVSTIDENHWEIVDGEKGYRIENTGTLLNIHQE